MYCEEDRKKDFEYFKSINVVFCQKNGPCFVAVRNQSVIDHDVSISKLLGKMTKRGYEVGTYLVQGCNGSESDYINTVMMLMINA